TKTWTNPTNSAPNKKKDAATPTKATTRLRAACINLGSIAAASAPARVMIAISRKATLFIRRSDRCASQIFFLYQGDAKARDKQGRSLPATKASPRGHAPDNARPPRRRSG